MNPPQLSSILKRCLIVLCIVCLAVLFLAFLPASGKAASHSYVIGKTGIDDFRRLVRNYAEGKYAQKLAKLSSQVSSGFDSPYWSKVLSKQFDASYSLPSGKTFSGHYFVSRFDDAAIPAARVLGSSSATFLCLIVYNTESRLTRLLICKDPALNMLVHFEDPLGILL